MSSPLGQFRFRRMAAEHAKVNRMNVHAIQTGTVAVKARQQKGQGPGAARMAWTLMDRQWTDPLPIYAWLIEHPLREIGVISRSSAQLPMKCCP